MPARAKILVVDDDRLVLGSVAAALRDARYRVWTADRGDEAVRIAVEVQPDIVVTDLRMPGMDGVALLEQVERAADPTPRMVIYSATPPTDYMRPVPRKVLWIVKASGHVPLLDALQRGDRAP
jgi:DNA-binding response OmpR family regulator